VEVKAKALVADRHAHLGGNLKESKQDIIKEPINLS
jgi:hypothetical protein